MAPTSVLGEVGDHGTAVPAVIDGAMVGAGPEMAPVERGRDVGGWATSVEEPVDVVVGLAVRVVVAACAAGGEVGRTRVVGGPARRAEPRTSLRVVEVPSVGTEEPVEPRREVVEARVFVFPVA